MLKDTQEQEPSVLCKCDVCGDDIHEGYAYRIIDDRVICDNHDCMYNFVLKESVVISA
ncbi:hypothetical protein [Aureibacillus halotolerans]|uniref:Uncharacterized protein n=1 Tax=Aureibacillus halotolerans TaxID=1508390 RepID=A0A4R6TTG3_9BACI|nr:hypothetical protein [Aureibacillus halotolerans]TDQ35243.1 hypothetical protein EV213_12230 [Aureibacillus halotolerans]